MIRAQFGETPDGGLVDLFSFANARGTQCCVMSYGGTIVSLRTPDRSGTLGDIVLGCDTLAGYFTQPAYLCALIGRCANRITGGSFPLDGRTYTLARNQGQDHLHGGLRGFDKVVWDAEPFGAGVTLRHSSPAGHGDVLGHELQLDADYFTPVGANLIPTGVVAPVAGTPFDFRTPRRIGDRIGAEDRQLHYAGGYDHNYVSRRTDPGLAHAARVRDPESGRTLDVLTTEPGVQLYTGNFLDGSIVGKHGQRNGRRAGFCLETQHYPDSPNRPEFPSIILRPDRQYRSRTVFKFGVAT